MELKDKKVLWLTDYTTKEVPAGGAEITDSWILKAARISNLNVDVIRPVDLRTDILDKADLIIFSNNYEFKETTRNEVMRRKPYIAYSHDSGRWMDVLKQHPDMFNNALGSIFLSPLHRDTFNNYLATAKNVFCIPPHITLDFQDKGLSRENKIMFVGNIHDGKGIPDIIKFAKSHKNIHIDFYYNRGQGNYISELRSLKNCHMVGYVPKEQIYENYNKYKYFIHIPRHYESFGRAVGEAFLSGCNIIVNDNVGACSYGWDYKTFRENTMKSHFLFWETIQNIIKS